MKSGPAWSGPTHSAFVLHTDPATSQAAADEALLAELESHGYPRGMTLQLLTASECNYVTASYFLLAEGKAEAARKLLPQKPWPFPAVHVSRSSSSSSSRAAAAAKQQAAAAAGGGPNSQAAARPATAPAAAVAATAAAAAGGGGSHMSGAQQQQGAVMVS